MYEIYAKIDKGIYRERNEDVGLIINSVVKDESVSRIADHDFICSVFDGVGGSDHGDIAAVVAARNMILFDNEPWNISTAYNYIEIADKSIRSMKLKYPEYSSMATTIAGVYISKKSAICFNVGDSRVYRFRGGFLNQVSKDHSTIQESIDSGYISVEDGFRAAKKNIITRCLGSNTDSIPYVCEIEILEEDTMLICSDGLSDYVNIDDLESILKTSENSSLKIACERLYEKAVENEAKDNISIILIREYTNGQR